MIIDFNRYNGGGGSGTGLSPVTEFPLEAEAGTVVAYNGTASASGVYQYTGEEWVPVGVDDLSAYWSSAQTEDAISAATSGKADKPLRETYPLAVSTLHINAGNYDLVLNGDYGQNIGEIWAPRNNGQAGQILVAQGGQTAPVWSAMTFPTPDVDKAYVDSAITAVEDHLSDVEQVTASALTELHDGLMEVSGRSVDLSNYYTSAQTEEAISAATSGKADAANVQTYGNSRYFPKWNEQGIITDKIGSVLYETTFPINNEPITATIIRAGWNIPLPHIYAPTTSGNPGDILVSTGNGAPVWSAVTFPTPDVDKAYVDSAITGVQDQLDVIDEVVPAALVDLNDRIVELSGSSVDLSAYYTSAQTEDAISAATSGKADAQNVTANNNKFYFPTWNSQGVIKGITGGEFYLKKISINGRDKNFVCYDFAGNLPAIYAPTTSGNPGEFLVADGTNTPKWSAVTFPDVSNYVTSAQVETQIVEKNYITSAATANMVTSTSVSTIWKGTTAEYDAITTKDASTLYIIL